MTDVVTYFEEQQEKQHLKEKREGKQTKLFEEENEAKSMEKDC